MTVSLQLANIADAISNISITGVTVKDKDQVAASWLSQPNVLYPNPENWITGFSIQYDTVLQGASAPMTIKYTLNYRLLTTQIGDIGTFPAAYSDLVDKIVTVLNALIGVPAPYSGKVELIVGNIEIGGKIDVVGNEYHGADIALNISEMQN